MNCFDILEIDFTTDKKEIKKAYVNLLKRYHPEENQEKFKEINRAYEEACGISENMIRISLDDGIIEDNLINSIELESQEENAIFDEINFSAFSEIFEETALELTLLFNSLMTFPNTYVVIGESKYKINSIEKFFSRWNFIFRSKLMNEEGSKNRIKQIIREFLSWKGNNIQKPIWDLLIAENERLYLFNQDIVEISIDEESIINMHDRNYIYNEIEKMKMREKSIKTAEGWMCKFKELYQNKSKIEEYDELFNEITRDEFVGKKEKISQILKDMIVSNIDNMTYELIYRLRRIFLWNKTQKNEFYKLENELKNKS